MAEAFGEYKRNFNDRRRFLSCVRPKPGFEPRFQNVMYCLWLQVNKTSESGKERITLAELSSLYKREEEEERIKEEETRMRKKINRLSC